MDLESLLELIATLSERINEHGTALRQSEALTRTSLVDPLLRKLGWDTADLSVVIHEYKSSRGSADYALLSNNKPAMIIEAKKLDTRLRNAVTQAINYCTLEGIDYFAVTDGRQWDIYETHRRGNLDEKRITEFDITHEPAEVCLQALALWRRSVQIGCVNPGQPPIVEITQSSTDTLDTRPIELQLDPGPPTAIPEPVTQTFVSPFNTDEWIPLSELNAQPGDKPEAILFPDESQVIIGNWATVVAEITRWLLNNNILNDTLCPIQYGDRYLLAVDPVHPNGEQFSRSRLVSTLYVYTGSRNRSHVRNAKIIINHVGQDPSQFKVRVSS